VLACTGLAALHVFEERGGLPEILLHEALVAEPSDVTHSTVIFFGNCRA